MESRMRRRSFLGSAAALGLSGHVSSNLLAMTPAGAAVMRVTPEAVRLRPEIEPVVKWMEETPARQNPRLRCRSTSPRARLSRFIGGPVPRRHPQREAPAGRLQIPYGPFDPFRPHSRSNRPGRRPPTPALLGTRHLQEFPGTGRQGRGLDPLKG